MELQEKINNDMKTAMKSGDKLALETLRMVKAQIKNTAIAKGKELKDQDVIAILSNQAKRRKDSEEMYRQGGREDLAEKEAKELLIINSYLPRALSEDELAALIDEAINNSGAENASDIGKVMGLIMPQTKGRADGKIIQEMVKNKLC